METGQYASLSYSQTESVFKNMQYKCWIESGYSDGLEVGT